MLVSRLMKHAALTAAGLVLTVAAGSVSAQAMPVQTSVPTLAAEASGTGVETIQYRDWRRERDWRRHEHRRYFNERRHFHRMEQHRRYREWRRHGY